MSMSPGSSVRSPRSITTASSRHRCRCDGDDALALDQQVAGFDELAGDDVEHAGAPQVDGRIGEDEACREPYC